MNNSRRQFIQRFLAVGTGLLVAPSLFIPKLQDSFKWQKLNSTFGVMYHDPFQQLPFYLVKMQLKDDERDTTIDWKTFSEQLGSPLLHNSLDLTIREV